jgi:hypothetical protein
VETCQFCHYIGGNISVPPIHWWNRASYTKTNVGNICIKIKKVLVFEIG